MRGPETRKVACQGSKAQLLLCALGRRDEHVIFQLLMPSSHLQWSEGRFGYMHTNTKYTQSFQIFKSNVLIGSCKNTWKGRDSLRCYTFLPEDVPPAPRVLCKTALMWLFFRRDGKYSFPGFFPKMRGKKGKRGFSLDIRPLRIYIRAQRLPGASPVKAGDISASHLLLPVIITSQSASIWLQIMYTTAVLN